MFIAVPVALTLLIGWGIMEIFSGDGSNAENGPTPPTQGTDQDEIVDLTDRADTHSAAGGDDTVFARAGFDNVNAGPGDDTVNGGAGKDVLFGGAGEDTLNGGAWNDVIAGGRQDDTLNGDGGRDQLFGEDGNDTLNGGAWDDSLTGGAGQDVLNGGDANDMLDGGVVGNAAPSYLEYIDYARNGTDPAITITALDDGVVDRLDGGDGNDELTLGAADIGTGGEGNDTFDILSEAFQTAAGPALIKDFTLGEDLLAVSYPEDEAEPTLTKGAFDVDQGTDLFANGTLIARIEGVDPTAINLDAVVLLGTSLS